MQHQSHGDVAALIGNGLSISFNPALSISQLTKGIAGRFNAVDPAHREPPERVLARLAARGHETGDPTSDFEAMLGPLDQQADNLVDLRNLCDIVGREAPAVANAIRTVEGFVEALQRRGKGEALDLIQEYSYAGNNTPINGVVDFIEAITATTTGAVTIGNLNYDALAMAALCRIDERAFCDMSSGWKTDYFEVVPGTYPIQGRELRTAADFPNRHTRLIHLHGSLTWLRNPSTGRVHRFNIDDLRTINYWQTWRDGGTKWEPVVVLTNQSAKNQLIATEPFWFAYTVFFHALLTADRWLIAGYSFRDACVNDILAQVWTHRKNDPPQILVVAYGNEPTFEEISAAIRGSNRSVAAPTRANLRVCRQGIAEAPSCSTWAHWAGAGLGDVA